MLLTSPIQMKFGGTEKVNKVFTLTQARPPSFLPLHFVHLPQSALEHPVHTLHGTLLVNAGVTALLLSLEYKFTAGMD